MRYWRFAGVLVALLWLGLGGWLWVAHPLLGNPVEAQQRLQADRIADGSLLSMAAMLPVVVDVCLLLTLAVFVFVDLAVRNERRPDRL